MSLACWRVVPGHRPTTASGAGAGSGGRVAGGRGAGGAGLAGGGVGAVTPSPQGGAAGRAGGGGGGVGGGAVAAGHGQDGQAEGQRGDGPERSHGNLLGAAVNDRPGRSRGRRRSASTPRPVGLDSETGLAG